MENKSSKYLKYAIGEIILVVFGILIALQINNWNENRKERQLEQVLLRQLQSEFQSNLDQLDQKIELRNQIAYAAEHLLEAIDNPLKRDTDSILKYISITQIGPTYDPIVNDLISSGRMQLIQNQELKERLSRLTSEIVQVTEEEVFWVNIRANRYIPYLYEKIPLRSVVSVFWENQVLSNFSLDEDFDTAFSIGKSKKALNLDDLLNDSKFESYMAQCASFTELINSQSSILRTRIVEILDIIEGELL